MRFLYSFLVHVTWFFLQIIAKFNSKISLFVSGRKNSLPLLKQTFSSADKVIWMHAASLGEYEQGLPLLIKLKSTYPNYKFLLTFFSPSGYEVKKEKSPADLVVYLPMDTTGNVKQFLDNLDLHLAIFIKYEIWPNYLHELKKRNIKTILVSGIFSRRQVFFKWYGNFMKHALHSFSHFFVQEKQSQTLLKSIGLENCTVSGDTRFDRVYEILLQKNSLPFMKKFKGNSQCFIAGSTWSEDEKVLIDYINNPNHNLKFVIAPHTIKPKHILELTKLITKKTMVYSTMNEAALGNTEVLIIDTIGLLTKIYSYADYAYVGGGFATGLHNTLEPAVFGIPVLIGPDYDGFNEAIELVNRKGIISISNKEELELVMDHLVKDDNFALKTGEKNKDYIQEKIGATETVMNYLETLL